MSVLGTLEGAVHTVESSSAWWAKTFYPAGHRKLDAAAQYEAVRVAAERWHVNPVLVWGVYGVETKHGADNHKSSTGALGPFQFEPETAATFHYPTNANTAGPPKNMAAFAQQADAAAHYLATLLPGGKGETGAFARTRGTPAWDAGWNSALHHYSGGGYGLAEVRKAGRNAAGVIGTEATNSAESAKVEEATPEGSDLWGKLAALGVELVLLLAGAVLVVYGIMVAVRPRSSAFSLPVPAVV